MANTTFSGPIRAGNIKNTTGTTVGTDIANVGYVVMCQDTVQSLAGGALGVGGNANTIINAVASGTTVGVKALGAGGGGTLEWGNTGTSDLRLTVTSSAATNAGSVRITIMYAQAFNTAIRP